MERVLVLEQFLYDYLTLVTRVTSLYRKLHHYYTRFIFARHHYKWIFNEWKNIIFTDESHFEVFNREKNQSFFRRLPSEADAPFNCQTCVKVEVVQLVFGGEGCDDD